MPGTARGSSAGGSEISASRSATSLAAKRVVREPTLVQLEVPLFMLSSMEKAMNKRLVKAPKGLGKAERVGKREGVMNIHQEVSDRLWDGGCPTRYENKKAWFGRVASELEKIRREIFPDSKAWSRRRVVAFFRGEARIVSAEEWLMVNKRLDACKQQERREEELRAELHGIYQGIRRDRLVDG